MKRQHLLLVIIFSAIATLGPVFAQDSSRKESVMIDSFGRIPNGDLRARLDNFLANLMNQPGARGLAYVLGTPAEMAARTRLIHNHMKFRGFDAGRISFKNGRNVGEPRTDLWLIPAEAAPPEIKPEGFIALEIGSANKLRVVKAYESFFSELKRQPDSYVSYIVNYGSPAQIETRERWFREPLRKAFGYHPPRMTFVNGGPGPVRTVMWLVPPGAETPKP